eukprot:UN34650
MHDMEGTANCDASIYQSGTVTLSCYAGELTYISHNCVSLDPVNCSGFWSCNTDTCYEDCNIVVPAMFGGTCPDLLEDPADHRCAGCPEFFDESQGANAICKGRNGSGFPISPPNYSVGFTDPDTCKIDCR